MLARLRLFSSPLTRASFSMPPKRRTQSAAVPAQGAPAPKKGRAVKADPDAAAHSPPPAHAPTSAPTTKKGAAAKAQPAKPRPRPAGVSPHTAPPPVRARCGRLRFADLPPDLAKAFRPRLAPADVIRAGSFGGIYFNPIGGKAGVYGRVVDIDPAEFPAAWFEGLPLESYAARRYDVRKNAYGVKAGQDQAYWESKGWIRRDLDPRGWFHWYCRFYCGRRCDDDARQISRWVGVAGAKGRWRRALANKAAARGLPADRAHEASPVIAQTLLHWADKVVEKDVAEARARMGGGGGGGGGGGDGEEDE
jgi:hypothetical protein